MNLKSSINAGRAEILERFSNLLENLFEQNTEIMVAVVGGSSNEPELEILKKDFNLKKIDYLGISDSDIYFDLNLTYDLNFEFFGKYDLVICSQVLEHVFRTQTAIFNLTKLLNKGGLLWIACPSSNHKHGSPDYYSAGYSPEMLVKLCEDNNLDVLESGDFGSERLYKMTHSHLYWPTKLAHKNPFLRDIERGFLLFPLRFIKRFMQNLQSVLWSPKFLDGSMWSTDTYILAKNKKKIRKR